MMDYGLQYWPMFLLDSDRHVGCAGLRPYRSEQRVYEFGVHLCRAFWGRGLAREAALAVIAHAFDTLDAEALFAGHHPANHASRQLLLKLGFVHPLADARGSETQSRHRWGAEAGIAFSAAC